jgi:hypothetical protein
MTATACSGSSTAQTTVVEPESTLVSGTDSAVTSTSNANSSTTVGTLSAAEALDAAVNSLLDAASYAFAASLQLNVQGTAIETEIEGWVDGPDRQLTLKADGSDVTTTVKDGVAIVERDGETTEVPLEEASDAPSLEILASLRNPGFDGDEITGSLNSSELKDAGFEVDGAANVVVRLHEDGSLAGYTINDNDGLWTIATTFFDIGGSFST